MTRKLTEVAIQFKPTPHFMFSTNGGTPRHQSLLVFELQPNEGIVQTLAAKQPGPASQLPLAEGSFSSAFSLRWSACSCARRYVSRSRARFRSSVPPIRAPSSAGSNGFET